MSDYKNRKRFWLIMDENGEFIDRHECGEPTRFHCRPQALKFAENMAADNEGYDIFILEATDFVRLAPPEPPKPVPRWKETYQD